MDKEFSAEAFGKTVRFRPGEKIEHCGKTARQWHANILHPEHGYISRCLAAPVRASKATILHIYAIHKMEREAGGLHWD